MPVNSVISHPEENTIVKPSQVLEVSGMQTRQFLTWILRGESHEIMIPISLLLWQGYAWAGGGRRIVRVDLTADGGRTWTSADALEQDTAHSPRHWSWTLWKVYVVFHLKKLKNNNLMRGAFFKGFTRGTEGLKKERESKYF